MNLNQGGSMVAWIVVAVALVAAVALAVLGVLFAGDPEGRGWGIAFRCFLAAGGLALVGIGAVIFVAVKWAARLLLCFALLASATARAGEADREGMERASALAVAETNAELCRREAEVTMQNARTLCEKRRAELKKLREGLRKVIRETRDGETWL